MNYENYTLIELRQLAKEQGIKNVSKLKKEELIDIMQNNKDIESVDSEKTEPTTTTENIKFYPLVNEANTPEEPE